MDKELTEKQKSVYNRLRAGGFPEEKARTYATGGGTTTNKAFDKGLLSSRLADIPQDLVEGIKTQATTWGNAGKRTGEIRSDLRSGAEGYQGFGGNLRAIGQVTGTLGGALANTVGDAFITGGKLLLTEEEERNIGAGFADTLRPIVENEGTQAAMQWYENLPENQKRDVDALGGIAALVTEIMTAGIGSKGARTVKRGVQEGVETVTRSVDDFAQAAQRSADSLAERMRRGAANNPATRPAIVDSAVQLGDDIVQRGRRVGGRIQEGVTEAAERRAAIQASTPARAEAIRVGVDDVLLNKIDNLVDEGGAVDKATANVLLDINEAAKSSVRGGTNALARLGDEAETAYGFINRERQRVGDELGAQIKVIAGDAKVDMTPAYNQLDTVLRDNGITPTYTDKGVKLEFGGGKSRQQRARIQELYEEATRLGDNVSPTDIHRQDQAFSAMKREARFDGVGDILVQMPDGSNKSLFEVLRDVYRETLDDVNPEIRKLNAQYAPLRQLQDDLDDTIFKAFGNYDSLRGITSRGDYSNNAFRRMFSNAQSADDYRELVNLLETRAREFGYEGANLEQAADLALDIQRLYPQGIQKTSLEGIMGNASRQDLTIGGLIGRALGLGKANLTDQQNAVTKLLEELAQSAN